MNVARIIKNNLFVRGAYVLWAGYFGARRDAFGYLADNVKLTPPYGPVLRMSIFTKTLG